MCLMSYMRFHRGMVPTGKWAPRYRCENKTTNYRNAFDRCAICFPRGSYFRGNIKIGHIFETLFLGCGVLSPLSNKAENARFWIPMPKLWLYYGTGLQCGFPGCFIPPRATCPPWGHRVMAPTGVTNVFDELHEVSSRNGAYG